MADKFAEKLLDYAPNLLYALLIFLIGFLIIKLIVKILRKAFEKSPVENTAASFLISLVRSVLYVILIVMILSQLKVPMSSIVAALGTAGLAIGLALRDSLSNVAGGFIVMFNRPFKAGDYVEINGNQGVVNQITILYTKLLTIDNKAIMIPNGKVASATIINYTQEELRRLELTFHISYSADHKAAEKVILDTVKSNPLSLTKPDEPFVKVSSHASNSLDLILRVWVKSENYWDLRFDLLAEVKDAFDKEKIEIPYNQLDIHIDK